MKVDTHNLNICSA